VAFGPGGIRVVSSLLEFKTETGESLLIEVAEPTGGAITRGGRAAEVVVEAGASLEQVLGRLGPAMKGIVSQIREAADRPDEVEVEFGVEAVGRFERDHRAGRGRGELQDRAQVG
jgi:hypothetical protein